MQRDTWIRPTVVVCVASLGLFSGQGCKGDDGNESAESVGDGDGETGDGDGDGDGDVGAWEFGPIYAAPNLDDDDGDGKQDWLQVVFDGDDEVGTLVIPAAAYAPGETIRFTLAGELVGIRFWHEGNHVLGSGVGEPLSSYEISDPSGDIELPYEFGEFYNAATLTLERVGANGDVLASATVEAVSSPLIMNHHLQPAEHLWIVQTNDNQEFVADYQAVLGDDVSLVPGAPYQHDRWIQDEVEFGFSTGPGGVRVDTVIDSIRDRGLDNYAEDYFSDPNWHVGVWGNPINATTFDSFGNLDAAPPTDGFPFGRIYYGREGNEGMDLVLADFLDTQTLQAPFPVDTAWLCVGHVDEFSSFVPDPSSPKGFKMLLSDTTAAYDLLESLDPSWELGRYQEAYGFATVGDLLADTALRSLNEDLQANELDPLRERFKTELGLTDDDIIDIPTVFELLDFCGNYVVALTPGTVNLIVANIDGQTPILAVPDPFARPENLGPEDDPIAQDFVNRMPDGLEVAFIDDWYSYHLLDGEVHCGTNVTRTPLEDWTTAGASLLGLEGGN
ncbi:MAG TPA: protein-arginine deiminase family protein [Enhygromyxa sp.]|nr:protein-arginine deiminase family protein [Enhygromyxa sp.]